MKTANKIAQSLTLELKERFGIDTTITAGMHYVVGESEQINEVTSDFINSWTIQHDEFSITVKPEKLYLTITSDTAKKWTGKVDGLPSAMLGMILDPKSKSHQYLLADPTAIDTMFTKIAEVLEPKPQEQ